MNMSIAGSGQIAPGEYDDIRIAGSGRIAGSVRCRSLHASGSMHADGHIECENEIKISGSGGVGGGIKAGSLHSSGAFSCGGDITALYEMKCSGSTKCTGSIKAGQVTVSGKMESGGDIEADTAKISGAIRCPGLLNAEDIEIKFDGSSTEIGSIGGSRIAIYPDTNSESVRSFVAKIASAITGTERSFHGAVRVNDSIEGDDIKLDHVTASRVSGRVVSIGDGCDIGLVQYSEYIEISPMARVGQVEEI